MGTTARVLTCLGTPYGDIGAVLTVWSLCHPRCNWFLPPPHYNFYLSRRRIEERGRPPAGLNKKPLALNMYQMFLFSAAPLISTIQDEEGRSSTPYFLWLFFYLVIFLLRSASHLVARMVMRGS